MLYKLGGIFYRVNGNSLDSRRLLCVLRGSVKLTDTRVPCGNTHTKSTAHTAKLTRKRKLTYKALVLKVYVGVDISAAAQKSHKKRYVKGRALLALVRRGKIYGYVCNGKTKSAVFASGKNSLLCFLYGKVGKSNQLKMKNSALCVTFYRNDKAVYSHKSCAIYFR